ncbi:MAG: phosphoribosylformylglycinamidine synthase subunit PurS [Bacteroidota bacterium]
MFHSNISITLRKSILDPQGKAVEHAIHSLGFTSVRDVRVGKHIELSIESSTKEEAEQIMEQVCKKLLANPVMEDYSFSIEKS